MRDPHGHEPAPRSTRARIVVGLILVVMLVAAVGYLVGAWRALTLPNARVGKDDASALVAAPVPAPEKAAGVRALDPARQLAAAFGAAFGSDPAVSTDDGSRIRYTPGKLVWAGDTAVLVSEGTNAEDCHACTGSLAVHYLKPEGDGFAVAGAWPQAVPGQGFGQPPAEWAISDRFADRPVIEAEGGYTGQGITCTTATLTLLGPAGPVASDPVPIGYSNEGAGAPARTLNGTIGDIARGRGFAVDVTGTERFTERYRFEDGRFVHVGGAPRLTC